MTLHIASTEPQGQWTPDQWHAIYTHGAHVLVAAAAGAGKTAVLVERIIQRILDPQRPCDVDRLLVVTFTDAAAGQMRDRIGKALNRAADDSTRPPDERARLRRQVALLDRAPIQTLHGFCLWLLRRYFYLLDIDPLFRVLDGDEATLLQFETMDRLLESEYDRWGPGDAFYNLIDAYRDARGDANVRATLLALHAYAASLPDPEAWFAQAIEAYSFPSNASLDELPWTGVVLSALQHELLYGEALMRRAADVATYGNAPLTVQTHLREEVGLLGELATVAGEGSWAKLHALFTPPPKFKTLRLAGFDDDIAKEQIRQARDGAKKVTATVATTYFRHTPDVELTLLQETGPHVAELIRLVRLFGQKYRQAKWGRAVVDFSDLERLALDVLQARSEADDAVNPADELRPMFAEVLVDEYQDINPLQDAILRSVSRPADDEAPNLFMVGDVKQSIYRFRLADPTLFMHRLGTFRPYDTVEQQPEEDVLDGVVIDLKANFRSRSQVIDGVNYIFRQILTPGVGELAYDARAELVAGATYPPVEKGAVELHIVERALDRVPAGIEEEADAEVEIDDVIVDDAAEHRSALESEAAVVAQLVRSMLDRGDEVYDPDSKAMRPIRYRDIAILLRSTKGRANVFVEALRQRGVPAYAELGTGFFWAVEVETLLAVLRVIDNPRQDIPLAAVLRSPWVDISTTDLAKIRVLEPTGDLYDAVIAGAKALESALGLRLRQFVQQLDRWRSTARRSLLGELIQQIYHETAYPEYVQGLPGGAQRHVNLMALLERAGRFDGFTQGGLARFLRFVDSLQAEDGDLGEAPLLGEGDDVVRIMSIHKSKGLQFPVVICANLGKGFNLSDRRGSILYHGSLGMGLQWADSERGLRAKTIAHHAVSEIRRRDAIAEELRVLYVALTRAQERLIMVGSVQDIWATAAGWSQSLDVQGWALPDYLLARARSPLDWIGPAVMRHSEGEPLRRAAEREMAQPLFARDVEVQSDPAQWSVRLWEKKALSEIATTPMDAEPTEITIDWEHLARAEPLGRTVDPQLALQLEQSLGQPYPFERSTRQAAKVSATLLAREITIADTDEAEPLVAITGPRGDVEPFATRLRKPLFVEEERTPTAAEQGTALHTLLYHLDLGSNLTTQTIRESAQQLVERYLLSSAQCQALNPAAIAHFFASGLGERLRKAARAGKMWREWAFTLGLEKNEVKSLLGQTPGVVEGTIENSIIVQGTIDVLWQEGERLFLLDYKTDRTAHGSDLIERYKPQIEIYGLAVQRITRVAPTTAYIVHLDQNASVSHPVALSSILGDMHNDVLG